MAMTRRTWIRPPIVLAVTNPRSQSTMRMTTMVVSMVVPPYPVAGSAEVLVETDETGDHGDFTHLR